MSLITELEEVTLTLELSWDDDSEDVDAVGFSFG